MSTVQELTGSRKVAGDVGIEIETEAAVAYQVPRMTGWLHKPDGSLRNFGVEYVSSNPVPIAQVNEHIDTWKAALGRHWDSLQGDSHSTSVHVHVNIGDLTPIQLLNFFSLSLLFENALCEFSGNDRKGNLFCLRAKDAEIKFFSVLNSLKNMQYQVQIVRALSPGHFKYSAINTDTVRSFGSLEFRMMRGEKDPEIIKTWVHILHRIKEYSLKFECPKAILKHIRENGAMSLFNDCFGDYVRHLMYASIQDDVDSNVYYVALIANAKDFKALPEVQQQPKMTFKTTMPVNNAPVGGVDEGFSEDFEEEDF